MMDREDRDDRVDRCEQAKKFERIDDAFKRGIVLRPDGEPHVGQCILDLGPLVKAEAAVNTIGHAFPHQRFFQHPRLGADPVQHRIVVVWYAPGFIAADPIHHVARFLVFIKSCIHAQFFPGVCIRP